MSVHQVPAVHAGARRGHGSWETRAAAPWEWNPGFLGEQEKKKKTTEASL